MSDYSEYEGRPKLEKQRTQVILFQRFFIFLILVYMFITTSFVAWNAIQATAARDRLLDCTEPSGVCFKQGAKRTGEAVTGIVTGTRAVIIATVICKDKPGNENDTTEELEKCVDAELKEKANE